MRRSGAKGNSWGAGCAAPQSQETKTKPRQPRRAPWGIAAAGALPAWWERVLSKRGFSGWRNRRTPTKELPEKQASHYTNPKEPLQHITSQQAHGPSELLANKTQQTRQTGGAKGAFRNFSARVSPQMPLPQSLSRIRVGPPAPPLLNPLIPHQMRVLQVAPALVSRRGHSMIVTEAGFKGANPIHPIPMRGGGRLGIFRPPFPTPTFAIDKLFFIFQDPDNLYPRF
ncbi:hypothetical protein LSM04_006243 [Trypanosoma melophagium]|uniref:uncharacterized protein n=1 Tax=Trypanosoma melophagium TaxID=715481 RepID=UPI00351A9CEC|nr:hypothetical protein LSM04_006243 [Trypanosoma melophagium]